VPQVQGGGVEGSERDTLGTNHILDESEFRGAGGRVAGESLRDSDLKEGGIHVMEDLIGHNQRQRKVQWHGSEARSLGNGGSRKGPWGGGRDYWRYANVKVTEKYAANGRCRWCSTGTGEQNLRTDDAGIRG